MKLRRILVRFSRVSQQEVDTLSHFAHFNQNARWPWVVEVEGQSIALFNVEGTYSAIDNTCTHVGGPLGEGALVGDDVSCPWHGAGFNVKTDECQGGPAISDVKSFPIKVEGNDVLIELE